MKENLKNYAFVITYKISNTLLTSYANHQCFVYLCGQAIICIVLSRTMYTSSTFIQKAHEQFAFGTAVGKRLT